MRNITIKGEGRYTYSGRGPIDADLAWVDGRLVWVRGDFAAIMACPRCGAKTSEWKRPEGADRFDMRIGVCPSTGERWGQALRGAIAIE